MARVIGVIPARYNSRRFPGKILADILGKSLIKRTYENAARCSAFDRLVVATDDERILHHVKEFGAEAVMSSPECESGTDRIAEVVERHFPDYEVVVNIQGDEPFLDREIPELLVEELKRSSFPMATAAIPLYDEKEILNPSVVKCVFDKQGRALYFSRSPIPYPQKGSAHVYYRHLGVYCYRREFLLHYAALPPTPLQLCEDLEQLKVLEYGFNLLVCMVKESCSLGVNTPEDLKKVEEKLCAESMSL